MGALLILTAGKKIKRVIRVVFYTQATLASCCLCMAIFLGMQTRPFSLVLPPPCPGTMLLAAIVLPSANLFLAWRVRLRNAVLLLLGQAFIGAVQVFLGIMPLLA